jgi:Raf kinase inhibitor-like YbhB/YbcL family protein
MSFKITSAAFVDSGPIPTRYACQGQNVSPPLAWSGAPRGVETYALILEDRDAPEENFVHWLVYNLPATMLGLPEDVRIASLHVEVREGRNDFGHTRYEGPSPPAGSHRYVFRLYALSRSLPEGSQALDAAALRQAIRDCTIAEAQLVGTYQKRRLRLAKAPSTLIGPAP